MGTLKDDIRQQSVWTVKAFKADNFTLDYSIDSFIDIDIFFQNNIKDGKAKQGGRLTKQFGLILFSIASYIGETIIKQLPGSIWITDDNDPEGEVNIALQLPDGSLIFPMQRVMKRVKNGQEDSIYVYGHAITSQITGEAFNQNYWKATQTKPWWKLW